MNTAEALISYDSELEQLTALIFDSMLHLPIEADHSPLPRDRQTVSACVHITGAWRGAVALSCDRGLAEEAASIMFSLPVGSAGTSDVQDAVGELANMIGGNFKALLPETCQLSLPSVVAGNDYTVRVPGSRMISQMPFRCGEWLLTVSLLQGDCR